MEKIESEKLIERKLRDTIRNLGGIALKLPGEILRGVPDRLILLPGEVVIFAETKTTGKKPSKIQSYVHNKLRGLGFKVYVIDSTKDVKQLVREYQKRVL